MLLTVLGKSTQRPDLKFPLSVGQTWTYQYETRPSGQPRDDKRSVEVTVAGMEQVTTPAGTFKAYKLTKTESWLTVRKKGGEPSRRRTRTYFYSPETKSIVKSSNVSVNPTGNVEAELIKFTPGN